MASNMEHFTPNNNTKDYYILSVNRCNFWDMGISWCDQVVVQSSGCNLNHTWVQSSTIPHFHWTCDFGNVKKLHKPILTWRTALAVKSHIPAVTYTVRVHKFQAPDHLTNNTLFSNIQYLQNNYYNLFFVTHKNVYQFICTIQKW